MRILVSTNATFGHVDPLVPLARALMGAGHELLVATEPHFCDCVRSRGFHVVAVGPDLVEDLDRLVAGWRPDLVLRESTEDVARQIAGSRSIPLVTVNVGAPDGQASTVGHPLLAFEPAGYHDWAAAPTATVFRPPIAPGEAYHGAFPGPVDRPLVYVTLGAEADDPDLMATMLGALADADWNVVVATGPHGNPARIDPGRPNVIVQHWVPQDAVLNDATAVLAHAGAGTTIGALVRGVPMVCLPQGADQFHHARRVVELGVGIDLDPDHRSPDDILDAVTAVVTLERYRSRAEELAFETTRLPDVAAAVDLVEALVSSG